MTLPSALTDLRNVLKFPFQGPHWRKHFLVGSALFLASAFVPILPAIVVYGYITRVLRQAVQGAPLELPAWDDLSALFKDGLRSFGIGLVFLGPGLAVMMGGMFLYFVAWFGGVFTLQSSRAYGGSLSYAPLLMMGAMLVLFGSMFVSWLLWLAGALPLPLALAHSVAQQKMQAAFDLPTLWRRFSADKWGYAASWVIVFGLFGAVYLAFMLIYFIPLLCFFAYILIMPLMFYALIVAAAVFGQFYRAGEPPQALPPAPTPENLA